MPPGFPLEPRSACDLLADQGLPTAGGYLPAGGGTLICSSHRKALPLGDAAPHSLRFAAQGTAEGVTELTLELELRSPGDVQAALRMLLRSAETLTERVLRTSVPAQAQVAIRSGVSGTWSLAGAILKVERVSTFATGIVVTLEQVAASRTDRSR